MKCVPLILAAGRGERMRSDIPKVLHRICGRALVDYAIDSAASCCTESPVVVVGHGREAVTAHLEGRARFAVQDPALGWGTAMPVKAARELIASADAVVVLCGDVPLMTRESVSAVVAAVEAGADAALLTAVMHGDVQYGRIIRGEDGAVLGIVEDRDCTPEQKQIREMNVSLYCFRTGALLSVIDDIKNDNAKGEYYLTDAIALLAARGMRVEACICPDEHEAQGVNDMADLALAEAVMRARINRAHMKSGVRMVDPERTYIDFGVEIGAGSVVYPGCVLEGRTLIGRGVTLGPGCHITDSEIADGASVESSTLVEAVVGAGTTVGPNAYLRPGARVGAGCRIGDFVEIKNSVIGDGTKVSHLTYVGDSDLGRDINIGCGVVFSNYDGKKKSRCTVGDHAFIGCNANLVAPLSVGAGAYVAAGSTVTVDVPEGALLVARERETIKEGWADARRTRGLLK